MRIPHIIYENAIKAYEVPSIYLRKEQVKSDDFNWDVEFIPKLRDLALIVIADNWERNPLYNEIQVPADKLQLLELISTNLPLELTVPIIDDDFYWERCYKARWPDLPEPNRRLKYNKPINVYHSQSSSPELNEGSATTVTEQIQSDDAVNMSETEINVFNYNDEHKIETDSSMNTDVVSVEVDNSYETVSHAVVQKPSVSIVIKKSWKQTFLQKFVEGEIERMKPDMFNPEYIKELTDLYGEYILCLNLKELQSCKNEENFDHVSLHSLLARLTNLIEFSVCFNKANLGDNFSWHATKLSDTDCELLGNGVQKSQIKILRVIRSDVDCKKLKFLIRPLIRHKYLHTLDLSHCKIADEGAKALAGMLTTNTVLENLILVNNKIGPQGALGLGYYMCQPECRLIELNLKLNPLSVEGGKYIGTALVRGAKTLRSLNISSCELTTQNLHLGLVFALNNTLQKLDLSNNLLGEVSGENFLKAMEKNTTLIHLDLRMCGLLPETVQEIESTIRKNLETFRHTLLTPPSADCIL